MDYYPFVPQEEDLDNYVFVSETMPNGRRFMWAVEKTFKPTALDTFGREHGLPPRMDYLGELRERSDDPTFCVHEMSRLTFLASVVWQKGGPETFDLEKPIRTSSELAPVGKCFFGGHDVYRPPQECYSCNNQFCAAHIDFLIDKWCCRQCGQRLQLRAL